MYRFATWTSFYYNVVQEAQKFSTSSHTFFQESPFCKVREVPIKLGSLFTEGELSELRRSYAFPDS